MLIEPYVKGAVAALSGVSVVDNPYDCLTDAYSDWLMGYCAGVITELRWRIRKEKPDRTLTGRLHPLSCLN